MDGEPACNAESSIVIEQRDLLFNHPATSFTTIVKCPCFAKHVRLACGSDWLQAYVNVTNLTVLGDGVCLLHPNQVLAPNTSLTFLYQYSPPLLNIHAMDASFFNCTSTSQTSSSRTLNTLIKCALILLLALTITSV